MTALDVLIAIRVLAVLASLGVAFANFRFVMRCRRHSWKWGYRLFVGFCGLYFAAIYLVVLIGTTSYILRSGILTIGGVVLLMMLNIADVIVEDKECK